MLRVRWLGRVPYREALDLQHGLHRHALDDYLLLLEHDHVFTMGARGDLAHVLVTPESVGAELVRADRGGDVTYHGPGQLVGYPIVSVALGPGAVPGFVHQVEEVVIRAARRLGLLDVGRLDGYPGVWVSPDAKPRKLAAVGVRVSRGRSMHGFALNVDPDMAFFSCIVPCGIDRWPVTSLRQEGVGATMPEVVGAVVKAAEEIWGRGGVEVQWAGRPDSLVPSGARGLEARMAAMGMGPGETISLPKPPWLRTKARYSPKLHEMKRLVGSLGLATVCEEAGCPNIFECWGAGTATFMINGSRCTRACAFCKVDTARPLQIDPSEPERLAEAASRLGLEHVVVTAVARDDLEDGGASAFAETIAALRRRLPGCSVEVLVPDFKGSKVALRKVLEARPDVFNHNLETVARLQWLVRPQASYSRSLAVLAGAKQAGLTTKSGLIVGMGEDRSELEAALFDLASVGVDIVTIGQYLRPSQQHLPVMKWWTPQEFEELSIFARGLGFRSVVASPLARSSYHAKQAAREVAPSSLRAG